MPGDDQDDDGRRDKGAESARAMRKALGKAALAPRIPHLHCAGRAGKRSGLAGAEKKQQDGKGQSVARKPRRYRHERPESDEDGENRPRAEALAQPAAWDLKQGIAPEQRAQDHALGEIVEAECLLDRRRRVRHDDPIEIGDEVHEADHAQNVPRAISSSPRFHDGAPSGPPPSPPTRTKEQRWPPSLPIGPLFYPIMASWLRPFCRFVSAPQAELQKAAAPAAQSYDVASRLIASTRATWIASRPVPSLIWWRQDVPSATMMSPAPALRTAGNSDSSP